MHYICIILLLYMHQFDIRICHQCTLLIWSLKTIPLILAHALCWGPLAPNHPCSIYTIPEEPPSPLTYAHTPLVL
jgi:hypothetical protein